jgi:hypothetical protein
VTVSRINEHVKSRVVGDIAIEIGKLASNESFLSSVARLALRRTRKSRTNFAREIRIKVRLDKCLVSHFAALPAHFDGSVASGVRIADYLPLKAITLGKPQFANGSLRSTVACDMGCKMYLRLHRPLSVRSLR